MQRDKIYEADHRHVLAQQTSYQSAQMLSSGRNRRIYTVRKSMFKLLLAAVIAVGTAYAGTSVVSAQGTMDGSGGGGMTGTGGGGMSRF
jgi:hypothetical protein